jgi:hypothetical protein
MNITIRNLATASLRTTTLATAALAAVALAVGGRAHAADWGTIKGKFVYSGKYDNKPVTVTKDPEFCSKHNPVDETIVLGDGGALQNMFVYLNPPRGKKVEVHPDYKALEKELVVLDNKECRFEPHCVTLWTAQTLEVKNNDAGLGHNTNASELRENTGFNETIPNDKPLEKKFTKSERWPSHVVCSIHPWMSAYLLIRDNPYMVVSDKDGTFEIKNVPAGKQTFTLWHEAAGFVRDVKVGKDKTDRKGEVDLTIEPGKTLDLGTIELAPKNLGQ